MLVWVLVWVWVGWGWGRGGVGLGGMQVRRLPVWAALAGMPVCLLRAQEAQQAAGVWAAGQA